MNKEAFFQWHDEKQLNYAKKHGLRYLASGGDFHLYRHRKNGLYFARDTMPRSKHTKVDMLGDNGAPNEEQFKYWGIPSDWHYATSPSEKITTKLKMDKLNMSKKAFERGFVKAALENGIEPITATQMLKQADRLGDLYGANMLGKGINQGLLGGGLGALGGGLGGYFLGKNKDPQKDHSTRNALLGAMGGGAIGTGIGGYNGLNSGFNDMKDHMISGSTDMNPQEAKLMKDTNLAEFMLMLGLSNR